MTQDLKTLSFDIGGTGLKAAVLDFQGNMISDRIKIKTTYPCPPEKMLDDLLRLVEKLPEFDRISMGFPGMVREGKILTAPHFITKHGPGTEISEDLKDKWSGFNMQQELEKVFGKPARVANDADVAGCALIKGKGLELVITLGTGFGTGLFYNGKLLPHLELAHHPFHYDQTYNEQLGEKTRKEIGNKKWKKRVLLAIETLYTLLNYDLAHLGGGNSREFTQDELPDNVLLANNIAGITGGIKLWEAAA
jgi:polyphosphate glucokinase